MGEGVLEPIPAVKMAIIVFFLKIFISLHFSCAFKSHICFAGMKWVAHRWPNFSNDFLKLISRCIPSWIPNEKRVKIGKSLIRWNGSPPQPLSLFIYFFYATLWVNVHSFGRGFCCYACVTPVCVPLWTVKGLPGCLDPKLNWWTMQARGANATESQLKGRSGTGDKQDAAWTHTHTQPHASFQVSAQVFHTDPKGVSAWFNAHRFSLFPHACAHV